MIVPQAYGDIEQHGPSKLFVCNTGGSEFSTPHLLIRSPFIHIFTIKSRLKETSSPTPFRMKGMLSEAETFGSPECLTSGMR